MITLNVCHLYGNLLNTYGDNGNLLILEHYGKKLGIQFHTEIISLDDSFDADKYDLVFVGGGQDYEQMIISKDIQHKKTALTQHIEAGKAVLAICGGYQLLGHYYLDATGEKIEGIGALNHYTLNQQDDNRYIGNTIIENKDFNETYEGFENHGGRTFLGEGVVPLGKVVQGFGNNGQDQTEGALYKGTYCSYFHGPLLAKNEHLAYRILATALQARYPEKAAEILS